MNLKGIGLDMSEAVFTLHGVGQDGNAVLRRDMRRAEMAAFFAKLPKMHVALAACGGSHHWGRRLAAMGHTVQQIPPQYVKLFVRRGKNDHNGAGAISEAAARPEMPSVAVKSKTLCWRQPRRCWRSWAGRWPSSTDSPKRAAFAAGIAELERRMKQHKANPVSALSLALTIDPGRLASGRHVAAWLGLAAGLAGAQAIALAIRLRSSDRRSRSRGGAEERCRR